MSSEDECYDADEDVIRTLLAKYGYNPDLPARGVTGRPGVVTIGSRIESGKVASVKLRNHVCAIEGVVIDGHSDPDRSGGWTCHEQRR